MERGASSGSSWRAALTGHAALIAFVLFVLTAGGNPIAIRFSSLALPPFWGGAARLAVAAAIFWLIVLARRIPLPRGRALAGVLLYGALGFGVVNGLSFWALARVQPGMASVFLAFVPLATVLVAAAHGLEPLTRRKVAGALIAVAGIALVAGGGLGAGGVAIPVLLALIAIPFALAESNVVFKLVRPGNPMSTNAVSLSAGALLLAGLSLLAGEPWGLPSSPASWAAFAYLTVIGSVVVFYLWLIVLARWPASRAGYAFVLLPVVSVAASSLLTGEAITPSLALGAAVALAGVWLGGISAAPRVPAPEPPAIEEGGACSMPTC